MNTRAKGNKAEREYERMLKMDGYITDRRRGTRNQNTDYFGVADVIAMNDKHVLLVQVKCNRSAGAVEMFRRFLTEHPMATNVKCIVAIRKDGCGGRPVEWREIEVIKEETR